MISLRIFLTASISLLSALGAASAQTAEPVLGPGVPAFRVRPGYRVTLVAENIGEVRFLEFGNNSTLYVSQPRSGAIITLRERDGVWTKIADFITEKPTAHGMHFYDGWLWFTQSGAVWKARDTDGDGKADELVQVAADLPSGGGHWWRSILVTPSGFYTSIGDAENASDPMGTDRQKIWKFNFDGSGKRLFASGLRNTEKLRLRPGTDEVWGSDHGSDMFGGSFGETTGNQPITDHIPPEEFNHYVEGGFYGHPFIVGDHLPRQEFRNRPDLLELAAKTIAPAWSLGAHWAVNGWTFIQSEALGLRGDAVMAAHGSWNSRKKVGYRVERILFDSITGQPMGNQMLVSLLDETGQVLGRPCDVVETPDGSLLFSDDARGRIYRITAATDQKRSETAPAQGAAPPAPVPVTSPAQTPVPTAAQPSPTIARASPVFRALDYFQNQCARCHGNYGSAYQPGAKANMSDASLRQKVRSMAEGPGQASLTDEAQLDLVLAFECALRDAQPFAAVSAWTKEGWLIGEALPGSKVWIENGGRTLEVPMAGHSWQVQLPLNTTATTAQLHIQRDGQKIVISLKEKMPKAAP